MADLKQVELIYGGATLPRNTDFSFRSKSLRNIEEKKIIGRLASELIPNREQIFLDSGTTCFEMVPHLKGKQGLSVIVNSTRLAAELGSCPNLSLIMLGGHYRSERMDCIGPLATGVVEQIRGYMAFIGADGLSMDFGVTASDVDSAHLYRLAVRNSRETILLVDHTKFLSPSLFKIVEWNVINRVVTDQKPNSDWTEFLENQGIEIIYPGIPPKQ